MVDDDEDRPAREDPWDEHSDPADAGDPAGGDGAGPVGEDRATQAGADGASGADAGWHDDPPEGWDAADDGNVFGEAPGALDQPVEPGSPRLENAAFVLLGVLLALALVADLIGLL